LQCHFANSRDTKAPKHGKHHHANQEKSDDLDQHERSKSKARPERTIFYLGYNTTKNLCADTIEQRSALSIDAELNFVAKLGFHLWDEVSDPIGKP